jgi:hypothetical protein
VKVGEDSAYIYTSTYILSICATFRNSISKFP